MTSKVLYFFAVITILVFKTGAHGRCLLFLVSLPVGVGVFLRRENPEFAILAAILENTRRGGAGRAIVDKEATRGEGAAGAKRKNAYWITIPLSVSTH